MEKIYCYVDESGQHSEGEYFLVSVVIAQDDRDNIEQWLLGVERRTGKNRRKWTSAGDKNRTAYIRAVLGNANLKGKLFSAHYQNTREYVRLTIKTTAQAIQRYSQEDYRANVVVDGLRKTERQRFAVGLRREGIQTNKVVGKDDQKDPFIRLADALCGFIADALKGRIEYQRLLKKAEDEGWVTLLQ